MCLNAETLVQSLGWEGSPGGADGYPLKYSSLENPRGERSLMGYSQWGCKESDMTEQLSTHSMWFKNKLILYKYNKIYKN